MSPENTPLFYPEFKFTESIGGSQIQQKIIGNTLKDVMNIHFVLEDLGQKKDDFKNGIYLHKAYNQNKGIRYIRSVFPRFTDLWKAMKRANADIYYQRVPSIYTGLVALFCLLNRKKFVYALANDNELLEKWKLFHYKIEKYIFNFGIKRANLITVQNRFQKTELLKKRNLNSTLVNNIYDGKCVQSNVKNEKKYVLSVGMINPKKQIELIIRTASKMPHLEFCIIGKGTGEYFNQIQSLSNKYSNISFLSNLSRKETLEYYQNAYLLLHTSKAEGFPNVFLESWANGIPVVSLKIDPNNYIEQNKLGFVVNDSEDIPEKIDLLVNKKELNKSFGENARKHIRQFHSPESIRSVFEDIFTQLLS